MIVPIENEQFIEAQHFNVLLLLGGNITIDAEGEPYSIATKTYTFFDKPFYIQTASPYLHGYVISLTDANWSDIAQFENELKAQQGFFKARPIKKFDLKKSMINSLLNASENKHLSKSYADILMHELITDTKEDTQEKNLFSKFKDLIEENIEHNYCAGTYADLLDIPLKQLIKEVKKETDKTPCAIITDSVIATAKQKLVNSESTSQMIAYELGFDDPYYFIKYFKKNTGVTPTQFREQQAA